MILFSKILIGIVAFEHFYILFIEMFSWEKSGKRTFKGVIPDELFEPTKAMAANQGLYNGFLAAGLTWTFLISDTVWNYNIAIFFLICVVVAAIYGAFTLSKKIFFMQGVPALVALAVTLYCYFNI